MKTFLHAGCGTVKKSQLPGFSNNSWQEIRYDNNEIANPDIKGTLTEMSQVKTGSLDAIYSSHNLEYFYSHEVQIVTSEFYRVLKDDGIVVIICHDLQSTCEQVAQDNLLGTLYEANSGSLNSMDILYGSSDALKKGSHFMAHKCGFTYSSLLGEIQLANFKKWIGGRMLKSFELCLIACKDEKSDEELQKLAYQFLP